MANLWNNSFRCIYHWNKYRRNHSDDDSIIYEKNLLLKGVKQIWRKPIEPNELIAGLESLKSI